MHLRLSTYTRAELYQKQMDPVSITVLAHARHAGKIAEQHPALGQAQGILHETKKIYDVS